MKSKLLDNRKIYTMQNPSHKLVRINGSRNQLVNSNRPMHSLHRRIPRHLTHILLCKNMRGLIEKLSNMSSECSFTVHFPAAEHAQRTPSFRIFHL